MSPSSFKDHYLFVCDDLACLLVVGIVEPLIRVKLPILILLILLWLGFSAPLLECLVGDLIHLELALHDVELLIEPALLLCRLIGGRIQIDFENVPVDPQDKLRVLLG